MQLRTAGGETVKLALADSGSSALLTVVLGRRGQAAFLQAKHLRELARECERLVAELDALERDNDFR